MAPPVDLLLFDLGGVLIEVPGVTAMAEMAAGTGSIEEIWARWLFSPWVRRYESGRCTTDEFAAGVVGEWGLPVSAEEFLTSFRGWPTGPFPGAEDLVREVAAVVDVACLSNTNPLHWSDWAGWPILDLLPTRFLSFQTGLLKPDREVFEHVVAATGVDAGRILFLDDNRPNVEAASAFGLRAVRVEGPAGARRALEAAGVLAAAKCR